MGSRFSNALQVLEWHACERVAESRRVVAIMARRASNSREFDAATTLDTQPV
jgi:hypothetical protein